MATFDGANIQTAEEIDYICSLRTLSNSHRSIELVVVKDECDMGTLLDTCEMIKVDDKPASPTLATSVSFT